MKISGTLSSLPFLASYENQKKPNPKNGLGKIYSSVNSVFISCMVQWPKCLQEYPANGMSDRKVLLYAPLEIFHAKL
jgi:hypothetical protein